MKKEIAVPKRIRLSKSQKMLFDLLCKKNESSEPIYIDETKKMYVENVCSNLIGGIPHKYNYFHHKNTEDNWVAGLEPIKDDEVTRRSICWLTGTIGILVIKGYLKIIPQIEL